MRCVFPGRRPVLRHVRAVIRRASPPKLGPGFMRLWCASAATNLGDGALLAAGPLLVASVSNAPIAVAGAVAAQQLPWLLLALLSGALVDRWDRRRLIVVVNTCRAAVLGLLATAVWVEAVSLPLLYCTLFVLGTGETLADNAAGALLVRVVPRDELGRANARLFTTIIVSNQLAGPPLGALLFAAGAALPFALHTVAFGIAALLVSRIAAAALTETARSDPDPSPESPPRESLRRQVAMGVRWLWGHRGLRTLAVSIAIMNVTFMAAFATWVLYARQELGLTETQFGLLLATGAVGGLCGSWLYPRLERCLGRVFLLRAGLIVEALTHLVLATAPSPATVFVTMAAFGVHAVVWGTVATTVRQRAVPDALLGRVTSVYLLASVGGAAIGAPLGGLVAQSLGLTAPFWIAAVAVMVLAAAAWRPLANVEARPEGHALAGAH